MTTVHVGSPLEEMAVVCAVRALDEGKMMDLSERANLRDAIEARKVELQRGLANPVAQTWTRKLQKEVEPLLRMRFCPVTGYVIDRWVESQGWWQQIPGTCGFDPPKPGLCERMLNQYDMWKRSSPKEDQDAIDGKTRHPIMQQKDKVSAAVKRDNEHKATEKVMAAVDSLSPKQIENFIAVEQARHTGEKLIHHGADLRFVEHVAEMQKTTPAIPEDMGEHCMNPGMNPNIYTRKKGGKHVRSGG